MLDGCPKKSFSSVYDLEKIFFGHPSGIDNVPIKLTQFCYIPDPISSCMVGPCTCTETMALNGYINICILWQEFSNWSPIYGLG